MTDVLLSEAKHQTATTKRRLRIRSVRDRRIYRQAWADALEYAAEIFSAVLGVAENKMRTSVSVMRMRAEESRAAEDDGAG